MMRSMKLLIITCALLAPKLLHAFSVPTIPSSTQQQQRRRQHQQWMPSLAASQLVSLDDTHIIQEEEARGLLSGIHDLSKERFFGSMDLSEENLQWLDEPDLFWSAAVQDAQELGFSSAEDYILKLYNSLQIYLDSTVRLEEQDPQYERYLEQASRGRGQFTLLLGGPHGKSNAARNQIGRPWMTAVDAGTATTKQTHFPVFVNVAASSSSSSSETTKKTNFAEAVALATYSVNYLFGKQDVFDLATTSYEEVLVKEVFDAMERNDPDRMKENLQRLSCTSGPSGCSEKFVEVLQAFEVESQRLETAGGSSGLEVFAEIARMMGIGTRRKKAINMVIDKAERFLSPHIDDAADTREALQTLLYWCGKSLNVFLVSSDLNYRWELRRRHTEFRQALLGAANVLIVGDRSPQQIWELLVNARYMERVPEREGVVFGQLILGFGPRLAKLLIAAYGSHLKTFEKVLADLAIEKQDFFASRVLPVHMSDSVEECLEDSPEARELLVKLARDGFAPLPSDPFSNEAVTLIAQTGIGGVVCSTDKITGLPSSVWKKNECKYGLIPTLQSTRLVIADVLLVNPFTNRLRAVANLLESGRGELVLYRDQRRKTTAKKQVEDAQEVAQKAKQSLGSAVSKAKGLLGTLIAKEEKLHDKQQEAVQQAKQYLEDAICKAKGLIESQTQEEEDEGLYDDDDTSVATQPATMTTMDEDEVDAILAETLDAVNEAKQALFTVEVSQKAVEERQAWLDNVLEEDYGGAEPYGE